MATKKNNSNSPHKKLSILISQDGLSFFSSSPVLEEEKVTFVEKHFEQILAPAEILSEIKKVFEEKKEIFDGSTEKLTLIFSNNLFAFVPRPLFDENHLSDYLKFNTKILQTDVIAFDELENAEVNNVFVPFTNINNYFFERFGEFEFSHSMSIWVENTLKLPEETTDGTFYVNVFQKHFELVVVKEEKLLLCNSFSFEAPEDFVYFLLFTAEQLKLDPEKFQLKFAGAISENSENYQRCYSYIRNCSFLKKEANNFSENAKSNPHYFLLKPQFYAHHLWKT